jgi:hypothetical protein
MGYLHEFGLGTDKDQTLALIYYKYEYHANV